MSDGVFLSLEEFLKVIVSREPGLSVENSYRGVLDELIQEKALRFFAKA